MAGGREITLTDVASVPVSIIARVPAVTGAMDPGQWQWQGRDSALPQLCYHYHYHYHAFSFHACNASMNQHVNCAVEIQIIGCQFDSNKVFLPLAFCRDSP